MSCAGFIGKAYLEAETSEHPDQRSLPFRSRIRAFCKISVDILIAGTLLLLAVPIIGVCAILIKITSPGPAFYSQIRLGLHGRPFRIWKLRTMAHNCEAITGPVWSCRNDYRVTPLGRILRDMYLDELPQLWNVLRGDMSLVGPRPERPEIANRIADKVPGFNLRLLVKPGLTGLAQLHLPPDEDVANVPHKLAYDLFYVRNQGLPLDLRIMISTAVYILGRDSACASKILLMLLTPPVRDSETIGVEIEDPTNRSDESDSVALSKPVRSEEFAELSAAA
jgi:lipopolysaccharide/colanic/teichoic acid biosynthesis glycosyltransferase